MDINNPFIQFFYSYMIREYNVDEDDYDDDGDNELGHLLFVSARKNAKRQTDSKQRDCRIDRGSNRLTNRPLKRRLTEEMERDKGRENDRETDEQIDRQD